MRWCRMGAGYPKSQVRIPYQLSICQLSAFPCQCTMAECFSAFSMHEDIPFRISVKCPTAAPLGWFPNLFPSTDYVQETMLTCVHSTLTESTGLVNPYTCWCTSGINSPRLIMFLTHCHSSDVMSQDTPTKSNQSDISHDHRLCT